MLIKLRGFEYLKPTTLKETFELIERHNGNSEILAGGTDLFVMMKYAKIRPQYVIDVKDIPELSGLSMNSQGGLSIGALTTIRALETSKEVRDNFRIISEAAGIMASVQVRNRATVGGNICHASPSAEMAPPLIALGSKARIIGKGGERVVGLDEFFTGPGKTVLGQGELLAGIEVPKAKAGVGSSYKRIAARKALCIATVNVGVEVEVDSSGICRDARIALGAVAPIPMRARGAEGMLIGQRIDDELILRASERAMEESKPIDDVRSSGEYRKEMVKVMTKRALQQAIKEIRG